MLKFYMTPGSCSTGIHILLEELEQVFAVYIVNLPKGDNLTADYLAINPKGTIPTLVRDDGTALTDFLTIAWWLAKSFPKKGLIPDDAEAELRVLEVLNYAVNTIHGHGFTRIFTTDRYASEQSEQERVKKQGEILVKKGFTYINRLLSPSGFVVDHFSIADVALFYNEFWAQRLGIKLPEGCQKHYELMLGRNAVRQVLSEEGYGSIFR
ncbi:glutathione S-transferase family protein [Thalassolituus sp.]|jgi:glutathione S-transferase|uniref:glutathione S-transferase family protein n=1 Tax=Thalassolituus sp. TaxID=2030822 RepID=UPI002A8298F9|nr:glutathione S-transferase N-terminal domain-containing protein [Thalassolituus sp.]|tara:strand:- start:1012 stop:1641 length:630 start_codon:yes stop_codon:yes gene_type:complete